MDFKLIEEEKEVIEIKFKIKNEWSILTKHKYE